MPYPNPSSTQKPHMIGSSPALHSLRARWESGQKRDPILVYVVTQQAWRAHIVDLEKIGGASVLASPTVALQYFGVPFAMDRKQRQESPQEGINFSRLFKIDRVLTASLFLLAVRSRLPARYSI